MTNVNWENGVAYTSWLSEVSGVPMRLPSEVEWEKACRGDDLRSYPWGGTLLNFDQSDISYPLRDTESSATLLNFDQSGIGGTTAVGSYPLGASPYGALDMGGNVWEWVGDNSRGFRVLRGGSFSSNRDNVRCAYRSWADPDDGFGAFGFRLLSPGS